MNRQEIESHIEHTLNNIVASVDGEIFGVIDCSEHIARWHITKQIELLEQVLTSCRATIDCNSGCGWNDTGLLHTEEVNEFITNLKKEL